VITVTSNLQNTDLEIIPGGTSSQLQVLYVAVNIPFKVRLRHLYGEWLLSENCPLTPTGNIRRPYLGQWIKTAWDDMSPEPIVKGFKKCCMSNNMNGTDDDVLWEEGHEENSS
jgi:hypothetical protein